MSKNQGTKKQSSPANDFTDSDVEPSAPQTNKDGKKVSGKPNKGKGAEGDGEEE